jgi:hypothetical protein
MKFKVGDKVKFVKDLMDNQVDIKIGMTGTIIDLSEFPVEYLVDMDQITKNREKVLLFQEGELELINKTELL